MPRNIVVVDYDPLWPLLFAELRAYVWPAVCDVADAIEHVGSTSVPGLAAKPIVDMSIVVPTPQSIDHAIEQLAGLGYRHRGNLGVEGREAFDQPNHLARHHLYLCSAGSPGLRNHLAVRDYLRAHPDAAAAYGELKKQLALAFPRDIDRYIDGKTDFIVDILRRSGLSDDEVRTIEGVNRIDGASTDAPPSPSTTE